ncbi:MAG: iron uptake transporter deferrochelatase/peroxidase subunit [Geminicoccaceae bacterium]
MTSAKIMHDTESPAPDRRRLLLGLAAAGTLVGGPPSARAATVHENVAAAPTSADTAQRQPFYGRHQAGIVTPRPAAGLVASFQVIAANPAELERMFRTLTERAAFLTQGGAPPELDPRFPPADSGILGPVVTPDNLTVTVSVGSSLFDDRYGLAERKPLRLSRMTSFRNDALEAARCHGDLAIQLCANTPDTVIHALRDVVKNLPDLLVLRWMQAGSVPVLPVVPGQPPESARNFLGFRDGSANPDSADAALMDQLVWVQPGQGEPDWASFGSYQAIRIIRNFVERWDRAPLVEQERFIGREKASGAPLGGGTEADVPDYAADPEGKVTPLDAHIRLANPRTPETAASLILRRPFNYSNGVTKSGQLDMGLLFICYQADLERGFIAVQKRLNGEPLEEYLKPVGGGYFFTLPGATSAEDYLGRSLLVGKSNQQASG